ncbi:MAG: GNAT family N-acetyltransferase [Pseudomonadota bacterium]|nr:GNAT family N-acetyltransferase [Pseudomonadota bacterium]
MIAYSTLHDGIDWVALKAALAADQFDNGRTALQMERSFRASFRCVYALDGATVVGTARALSDGVCNAYIIDMWTHSRHRRHGVGRRMIELLCESLAGQHVYLFTDDQAAFYGRCGFTPRGVGLEKIVGQWLRNDSD